MPLDDRLISFLIGCAVGAIFSYIVTSLRYLKEELDEVDEIVKGEEQRKNDEPRERDEGGFIRLNFTSVALAVVVLITAFAAFQSQSASNSAKDAQDAQRRITSCNQIFLSKTIKALNERTEFTQRAARANVHLQEAQAQFFGILLHKPPFSQQKRNRAAETYFESLNSFIALSEKTQKTVAENPYPTDQELTDCLNGK